MIIHVLFFTCLLSALPGSVCTHLEYLPPCHWDFPPCLQRNSFHYTFPPMFKPWWFCFHFHVCWLKERCQKCDCKHAVMPEAARWWHHRGGKPNTGPECMVVLNPIFPYSGDISKPILLEIQVIRSLSPSQSESGHVCSPHPCLLMSLGSVSHPAAFFHGKVCLCIWLYPALFIFSRLCMCLFPLMFLVNRSFLPPSCLYQLIYTITCLPALFSEGPAPSGIPISTSKEDWSGCF